MKSVHIKFCKTIKTCILPDEIYLLAIDLEHKYGTMNALGYDIRFYFKLKLSPNETTMPKNQKH